MKMKLLYVLFVLIYLTEYYEYRTNVVAQIADGTLINSIEDYSFMMGMFCIVNSTWSYYCCGGTIVSPWKIVTAAHCLFEKESFSLIFGSLNLNKPYKTMTVDKNDFILHPQYSGRPNHKHDIGVIQLKKALNFEARINKIEMLDDNFIPKSMELVTKLGYTEYDKTTEKSMIVGKLDLRYVNSTIHEYEACRQQYQDRANLHLERENLRFCVSLRNGNMMNSNSGDSGSPIITRDKRFLGIHSLSIPSHRLPEVGVLIPAYRAWIANPWELKTQATADGKLIYNIQVHKFMVALQYTKGYSDVRHTCGATIISNSKILTSARCVYGTRSITLLLATINSDEPYYSINVSDEQVFVHPDYDEDTFANNIAVLEIPLKFSSKVGKIDMIEKTSLASIKPCADVLMYGYMESNSPNRTYTETHLRSIDTKLANFSVCQDIYSGYVNLDKEKQFCLQSVEQCSGGPILTKSKKLLGIISHSTNGLPDVGTSVVGHRKFINNPRNFRPGSTAGGSGGQTSVPSRQTSRSSGSNVPSSSGSQTTENELVRKIEDNKYTAALLYKDDINGDRYLCSATIITNYKVLAAAHCLHNKYSVTLELGTLDTDIQYSTVNVSTQEIFVHPQYSADPIYVNDIAVILLKKALKFDSKIGKIDMVDKKYVIDTDDKVTLLGHSKGYLRYFNSTIAGFVGCRRSYWEKNNDNPWLEEDRQFCVTVHDGEENIGTGYSGGPVVTAGGKLIGIFSYDFNSLPEVCTSVIGHRSFIDDPKGFCVSDTETGRSNIQTGVSSRPTGGSSGSSSGGSSVTQASNSKLVDKIEDYKFVAAIISTKSGSGSRIVCGATVVSSFKVMTAASCVIDTEAVALIAGALNSEEPHQTVNITGKEIIIHPGHKGIAMIQLKSSLKFGTKIGKIDLVNVDYKPKDAEDVNIFGYLDNRLHFINTTIHDFVASRNNDDPKEDSQFYISSSTTDNRQNRQYAGGPVTTNGKVKKLIGIMSYGSDGLQPVCTLIEASKYREFILNPRIYAMKYRQKN